MDMLRTAGASTARAREPISVNLCNSTQQSQLSLEAIPASLGCGNPNALAALQPGEIVLDLGSGGGIDVLLSARRLSTASEMRASFPPAVAWDVDLVAPLVDERFISGFIRARKPN